MPIHEGKDSLGKYLQWGQHGKKYYFHDEKSYQRAYEHVLTQIRAIFHRKKRYY